MLCNVSTVALDINKYHTDSERFVIVIILEKFVIHHNNLSMSISAVSTTFFYVINVFI